MCLLILFKSLCKYVYIMLFIPIILAELPNFLKLCHTNISVDMILYLCVCVCLYALKNSTALVLCFLGTTMCIWNLCVYCLALYIVGFYLSFISFKFSKSINLLLLLILINQNNIYTFVLKKTHLLYKGCTRYTCLNKLKAPIHRY